MTTETRRRIRAYKKALPELRERVIAVALLLAMSVSMLASASFAWITLSAAPEVSGMQTTVAANGNLEIALAHGPTSKVEEGGTVKANAIKPEESAVGDSSAAEDQSIVGANVTWGNLVNVSDPTYGLSNIALRPALISESDLDEYPLYGATYGGDGRVIETGEKYEYVSWKDFGEGVARFVAGTDTQYGVRAIASTTAENVAGNVTVNQFKRNVEDAYKAATNIYTGMVTNDREVATKLTGGATCIEALDGLVTIFAQDKVYEILNKDTKSSCSPYLYNFYEMLVLFRDALDEEGKALLNMANWQAYNSSEDGKTDTFESIEDLKSKSNKLSDYGVTLTTLAGHITDYDNLQKAISSIEAKAKECHPDIVNKPKYIYDDIATAVSYLVDIGSTTLDGTELSKLGMGSIGTIVSDSTKSIVIKKGILKNYEARVINNTDRMYVYMEVTVKDVPIYGTKTVKGNVFTSVRNAEDPTRFTDMSACKDNSGSKARAVTGNRASSGEEVVAKDTYGMALDMWVRTNYPEAVLTLEGSPVYKDEVVTGVDDENKTVDLYVITVDEVEFDVYQKNGKWYYAREHSEVLAENMGEQAPVLKTKQVMVGYQGENRIWSDWEFLLEQGYIEKDATTQGAGSCFVFYADPTEQTKILDMLGSFTVVFANQDGKNLGTARLNTESHYSNQGKVIVPLEMVTGQEYTDESGDNHVGIMRLTQNTPAMITAIIYLNGKKLENENVLADDKLQGQLNIQFGTSTTLVAPRNEELQSQYRTIMAEVTVGNQISTNRDKPITLEYAENGHNAHVKLTIEGEQPERITGFFVRVINSTQGTRGDEGEFTMNPDTGEWSADFTLTAPGNYVFNTVTVDGIQYTLHDGSDEDHPANHPGIYIDGLKLESVSTDKSSGTYLQTEGAFPIKVTAKVNSVMEPKQVTALFVNEGESKQFTALMNYDEGNKAWVGTANITSSDTYILRNIVVDGNPLDVPLQNQTTVKLYLGLRAGVYTTLDEENWRFKMLDQDENGQLDIVTVPLFVRVWNGNELMDNLSNVTLYYHSNISHMDSDGYEIPLTWSYVYDGYYYAGEMGVDKLGTFQFDRLSVSLAGQSSPIYNLISAAPVFTGYSPEPPEYDSSSAEGYQLAISESMPAKYYVRLKNHENAQSVTATFARVDAVGSHTETLTSSTKETGTGAFVFDLAQDGRWTLTNLHVVAYSGEIDLVPTGNVPTTKVVRTPSITVKYDGAVNDFKNSVQFKGDCLETHTSKTVEVVVTDYEGQPIQGMTDAAWVITHDATKQKEYGGYAKPNGDPVRADGNGTMSRKLTADIANGTVSGTAEFTYAGEYTSTITLNFVDDHSYTFSSGTPKFTVKSDRPNMQVTAVSSNSGYYYPTSNPSSTTGMVSTSMANNWKSEDGYTATVYMYVTSNSASSNAVTIKKPTITLGLTDVAAEHDGARIDNFNAANFAFTAGSMSTKAEVGAGQNGEYDWGLLSGTSITYPVFSPAGKQTIQSITIMNGDIEVVAELKQEVVINNPQCPYYAQFVIDNSSYSGNKPANVISTTGDSQFTVELPDANDVTTRWTESKTDTVTGAFEEQSNVTTTYYETWNDDCDGAMYQQYDKHVIVSQADETVTTYTRTWTLTGWKVGNTTYALGETITVTGSQTISAVITYSDSGHQTTEYVVTRTVKYFTTGSDTVGTPPSGYKNITSDSDNGNKDRWTDRNRNTSESRALKN